MRSSRATARSLSRKPEPTSALQRATNNVRVLREQQLLTKAELARKAGISALTLARIEGGSDCRVDTKRKIIFALGLAPTDKDKVFGAGLANAVRKGR
jgi:DNA-binding XRE family transcriptional regulator